MKYVEEEILGISPFVHLRRESEKITIAYLPHLSLRYGAMAPHHAAIFSLIDGKRTVGEVIDAVCLLTDLPREKAREYLFKVLDFITPDAQMLVRDALRKKVSQFDPLDFIIPADQVNITTRLEAPVTMMFPLTYACEANCVYCYACRRSIPPENRLSTKRILELLDEMAFLGVWQVNFCGGDPFCHRDILTILERAISLGMTVDISTKAYLDRQTVKRLAQIGLDYIQVSIEAADAKKGDFIYRRAGQYNRVIKTLEHLLETDIFVRTNSIIIRQNLDDLEAIILKLKGIGVKEMKFSPAFRSMHINNTPYILDADEIARFEKEMVILSERYKNEGLTVLHSVMPDPTRMTDDQRRQYWFNERPICSSGRCSMIVTPDGKVSICEEAPQVGELIVGDVTSMSLSDVWKSSAMMNLAFPDKERFEGTPCADCEHFESCVIKKGHCFKDAFKGYGRLFTVNPFCPKAPKPLPRLY